MLKWAQQKLADVAGTQEPIYGPEAIQPVTKQAEETPYTELTKSHLKWTAMDSSCVETQTFYMHSDEGRLGMAQVIYSNVQGLHTTCQFDAKIFGHPDGKNPNLWISDPLYHHKFSQDMHNFYADNCSIELSGAGDEYHIKSSTSKKAVVDLKFKKAAPGFMAGKNGTTFFGTDPEKPWASMYHAFWPICAVEGSMVTQTGPVDFKGRGIFIHALQGAKPHHLGARWNFVNFQSPTYSAIMMEFTTPPSYGKTIVNVGSLARDGVLDFAGAAGPAVHTQAIEDPEVGWPEPVAASYKWTGVGKSGKPIHVELAGSLGSRLDRVDIMVEVPKFVKQIIASAAGTKPYIYQFGPRMKIKVEEDGKVTEEEGLVFTEATFIS